MARISAEAAWAAGSVAASVGSDDELHHVALDDQLAGHERLHPGGRVAGEEQRLGGLVVGGDGDVRIVELAELHHQRARRGVDVAVDRSVAERARR